MSEETKEIGGVEIASETMLGDLMGLCVDEIKALPEVWQKLSEEKQDRVIGRIENRVRAAVKVAVELIAANGRSVIPATLEQVTVKDGIKGVLTVSKVDPKRHELTDAVGRAVLIVVADPSDHCGGAGSVKPDPDQPGLPIDGGGDAEASGEETAAGDGDGSEAVQVGDGGGDEGPEMSVDEIIAGLKARGYAVKKAAVIALEDADYFAVVDYLQDRGPAPALLAQYAEG